MCDCEICKRHRAIKDAEKAGDVAALVKIIWGLEVSLEDAETERDSLRGIMDGSWPNAETYLEAALAKERAAKAGA